MVEECREDVDSVHRKNGTATKKRIGATRPPCRSVFNQAISRAMVFLLPSGRPRPEGFLLRLALFAL